MMKMLNFKDYSLLSKSNEGTKLFCFERRTQQVSQYTGIRRLWNARIFKL